MVNLISVLWCMGWRGAYHPAGFGFLMSVLFFPELFYVAWCYHSDFGDEGRDKVDLFAVSLSLHLLMPQSFQWIKPFIFLYCISFILLDKFYRFQHPTKDLFFQMQSICFLCSSFSLTLSTSLFLTFNKFHYIGFGFYKMHSMQTEQMHH